MEVFGYTSFMNWILSKKYYIAIIFIWLATFAIKIKFNGLIYGLDFGLLHPDGSLYAFRALSFLGYSQEHAALEVSSWYSQYAQKFNSFEPESLYFQNNPNWTIFQFRILYPILSIPFVKILGLNGMLVIPAFSLLAVMVTIVRVGFEMHKVRLAFFIAVFLSFSLTVQRWMFADITDGLLVAIMCIYLLMLVMEAQGKNWYFVTSILIIASGLTRFSLLLWLSLSFLLFIEKKRRESFFIGLLALVMFVPTFFVKFDGAILATSPNQSILGKLIYFPFSMGKIAFFELGQLAVLDRYLLLFLCIGIYLSIRNIRDRSSKYFIAVLLSLWATGALNGVVGVNFRYQLPILPFLAWVYLENFRSHSVTR